MIVVAPLSLLVVSYTRTLLVIIIIDIDYTSYPPTSRVLHLPMDKSYILDQVVSHGLWVTSGQGGHPIGIVTIDGKLFGDQNSNAKMDHASHGVLLQMTSRGPAVVVS